ncbi:MAG: hypothetical protein ACJ763_07070 [Bdellovibrionia bacterium]
MDQPNLEVSSQEAKADQNAQEQKPEDTAAKPGALTRLKAFFKDLFGSLFSSDAPTRRTALLFFLGIVGIGFVSVAAVKRIRHVRARQALELKERELEEKKRQETENSRLADLKSAEYVVSLGRYVVALKPVGRGPAPKADFELFVRCNEKEVREYIEARSVQVRSELTSSLVGMAREDFLAIDGKRRTHKKILLILNQWLAREYSGARIEDAWFGDLVVE